MPINTVTEAHLSLVDSAKTALTSAPQLHGDRNRTIICEKQITELKKQQNELPNLSVAVRNMEF